MPFPRLVLAGTHSGSGKTTLSLALMAAFTRRGVVVQPFKTGPDYIDPPFHTLATGRICRNLDAWLLKEPTLLALFRRHGLRDGLSLIEGVMGLFDGQGTGMEGSTAHLAAILRAPVVLAVNAEGLSLSAAALVSGYASFRPEALMRIPSSPEAGAFMPAAVAGKKSNIAGVVLNRVSSPAHYALLKDIIEERTSIPCFGFLAKNAVAPLPCRHLGLVPAGEQEEMPTYLSALADAAENSLDLDGLLELARAAPVLPGLKEPAEPTGEFFPPERKSRVRIGVAKDAAFAFYYQDNLDLLEDLGAELAPFSPLRDTALPPELHGLYLGGGFPETFAAELEANASMRASVRQALEAGLPAYAECGGMLYLCASLVPAPPEDGASGAGSYAMTGFFPHAAHMTSRLQRPFGYLTLQLEQDCLLGSAGTKLRAHEFHYTQVLPPSPERGKTPPAYTAFKNKNGDGWSGGLLKNATLAMYPHLHFHSCPRAAASFVRYCREYRDTKQSNGKDLWNRE